MSQNNCKDIFLLTNRDLPMELKVKDSVTASWVNATCQGSISPHNQIIVLSLLTWCSGTFYPEQLFLTRRTRLSLITADVLQSFKHAESVTLFQTSTKNPRIKQPFGQSKLYLFISAGGRGGGHISITINYTFNSILFLFLNQPLPH